MKKNTIVLAALLLSAIVCLNTQAYGKKKAACKTFSAVKPESKTDNAAPMESAYKHASDSMKVAIQLTALRTHMADSMGKLINLQTQINESLRQTLTSTQDNLRIQKSRCQGALQDLDEARDNLDDLREFYDGQLATFSTKDSLLHYEVDSLIKKVKKYEANTMNVVGITNLMDASKADLFKKMALAKEFSKMTPLELASAYSGLVMYASTNIGGEHYLLGMLVTPSTVSGIEEEVIRWMHVVYATTQGTDKHKNALLFQNITGRSFE